MFDTSLAFHILLNFPGPEYRWVIAIWPPADWRLDNRYLFIGCCELTIFPSVTGVAGYGRMSLHGGPGHWRRMLIAIERYDKLWRRCRKMAQNDIGRDAGDDCHEYRYHIDIGPPTTTLSYEMYVAATRLTWNRSFSQRSRSQLNIIQEVAVTISTLWWTSTLFLNISFT